MSHRLEYDRTSPTFNRRPLWFAGGIIVLVLLAFALREPFEQWQANRQRQRQIDAMLQLQAVCMRESVPDGTIVLDHSPDTPATLRRPGYQPITDLGGSRRYPYAAVRTSGSLTAWQKMAADYDLQLPGPGQGVAFMHERETPSGISVLVIGFLYSDGQPDPRYEPSYELRLHLRIPSTSAPLPVRPGKWGDIVIHLHRPVDGVLKVYAGQPDATDPSHFVIPVTYGDHSLKLHCWLRDDFGIKVRADGGVVNQDDQFPSAYVYRSWPSHVNPATAGSNWHRGSP